MQNMECKYNRNAFCVHCGGCRYDLCLNNYFVDSHLASFPAVSEPGVHSLHMQGINLDALHVQTVGRTTPFEHLATSLLTLNLLNLGVRFRQPLQHYNAR